MVKDGYQYVNDLKLIKNVPKQKKKNSIAKSASYEYCKMKFED